jgi:GNAT superfamily N-acetyltransferase
MSWYIRKIKPDEKESFIEFLAAWVTNVPVRERFRWLYEGNPHGKGEIWLAVDRETEKIAACTAIFPKKMRINGVPVLGCTGGDTYVDPQWRRKGIAVALHKTTLAEMKEVGIHVHYGFPLADNFQAKLKAGALHPGHFSTAVLHLSIHPLLKKMKLDHLIPGSLQKVLDAIMVRSMGILPSRLSENSYTIGQITSFDGEFETAEKEISSSSYASCVRDVQYMKWRFFENPFRRYTILGCNEMNGSFRGYVALESAGATTVIGDLFAYPEEKIVTYLLQAAVKFAVSRGSRSIVVMMNPEEAFGRQLLHFGFRHSHENHLPLIILTELADSNLGNLKNWHLTAADLDV